MVFRYGNQYNNMAQAVAVAKEKEIEASVSSRQKEVLPYLKFSFSIFFFLVRKASCHSHSFIIILFVGTCCIPSFYYVYTKGRNFYKPILYKNWLQALGVLCWMDSVVSIVFCFVCLHHFFMLLFLFIYYCRLKCWIR